MPAAGLLAGNAVAGERMRTALRTSSLVGTFLIEHLSIAAVRTIALAGFDFVIIDLEHSTAAIEQLPPLLAAAAAVQLPAVVRVSDASPGALGKVLDMTPAGVMVPRVQGFEEATEIVRSCRYPPLGSRGFAPTVGLAGTGLSTAELGAAPLVIVQIETRSALNDIDRLVGLEGIDALFVGPYDLAQALGTPGQLDSAAVQAAIDRIGGAGRGKTVLGSFIGDPARTSWWRDRGFRLLCVGFDGNMLLDSATRTCAAAWHALDSTTE